MDYFEKTISSKDIYAGRIITVKSQVVELPNGKHAERDLVLHPGASVVIPMTEDGQLYMVDQFRKPIEKMSLELPAGKLDPGEDPYDCAVRELKEETGLDAKEVKFLMSIHSTPGFCNEVLHLYLATGLTEGEMHTDEDEFLNCHKMPVTKLLEMVMKGEITDGKTITGVFAAGSILRGEYKFR